MKKYLTILIIIIAFSLFSCYKETLYNGLEKILFVYNNIENDRSNNITVYTINIKGKDLKKIFNVKTTAPPYNSDIITNQETIELIEKNKEKVKFLFTKPLRCFSGNFCAYSNYLDSYDVVAGGEVYKGVYLYDLEKEEEIKIDNKIPDIIPSLFSKDGNLYITSLSFSYDGNYLFFVSINGNLYVYSILSNEVNKLIGSSEEIFGLRKVDRVGNLLYFILGDTESSLYEFNIITGEKNI
ncbi:MAG: hypothetical protein H5U37_06140, partial [Caldisericia bacterium]|nr:hypothetical protein [Caldisericia bacterium]